MTWQAKLGRAKRHYAELETALASFFAATPYRVSTRRSNEGKLVYCLSEFTDVPVELSLITGDVIQNLRSALDHLAYTLWVNEANGQGREDRIYFPIDKNQASYNRNKSGKTRGISQQSLAIIDSLNPYPGGNDVLWRIHNLNNCDKHRLVVTVGSSFQSMDLAPHMLALVRKIPALSRAKTNLADVQMLTQPMDNLFPLRAGEELFIAGKDSEEIPDMLFNFGILLNEPGVVDGEPLTDVLSAMVAEIERIGPLFNV